MRVSRRSALAGLACLACGDEVSTGGLRLAGGMGIQPTTPPPAGFTPLDLAPAIWISADSFSGADGSVVAAFTDQSGNSQNGTEVSSGLGPLLRTTRWNGQ